jgi:hypothetical protein
MWIINTIRKQKKSIAIVFATSILAVIACDLFCSVDPYGSMEMMNQLAVANDMDDVMSHHQHAESPNHHASPQDITSHSHSIPTTEQDDNCCEDMTNQFYKSLYNGNDVNIIKAPVHSFILLAVIYNDHFFSSSQYSNPFGIPLKIPPDSNGNYLRILISSFLI